MHSFLSSVTPALTAWSLEAAILVAAAGVGTFLFRRRSAAARHRIWALAVATSLALPLLDRVPSRLGFALPSWAALPTASHAVQATAITIGHARNGHGSSLAWIGLLWSIGAAITFVRILRSHLAARRLGQLAERASEKVQSAAESAATSLGIARTVDIVHCGAIGSPMTIGIFRARVLLPIASETWSDERLRAVLLHELGHVRRRDNLVQLAAQIACAIHWCNPLLWLAEARLRVEREYACDDLVLGAGVEPTSYAADLLDIARSMSAEPERAAVGILARSATAARLRHVLDASKPREPLGTRFRAATLTIALASTLACVSARLPSAPIVEAIPLASVPVETAPATMKPKRDPFTRAPVGSTGVSWLLSEEEPPILTIGAVSAAPTRGPTAAIDLWAVDSEIRRHLGDLEECYQQRLLVHPNLTGEVVAHWRITRSGDVAETCLTRDTVRDAEIRACVNQVIEHARFPTLESEVDVSLPFVFAGGC